MTTPASSRKRPFLWSTLIVALLVTGTMVFNHRMNTWAQDLLSRMGVVPSTSLAVEEEPAAPRASTAFALRQLPNHPERLYTSSQAPLRSPTTVRLEPQFRELLDQYTYRQGIDDNFTIRVTDNRTDTLLELFTLTAERETYLASGEVDWREIDRLRREETRRLVDKYEAFGIPREHITAKWGRRNQVIEARTNEETIIEYELRLASYLGLSLLATEIGTVETFNNDRLVSGVGARSRYQMMPYVLRQQGVHHYRLETSQGRPITVREEWHPLLTMEAAFLVLRGYINAVGHELPGLSAYHTGPNNIYKVYRLFLTEDSGLFSPAASVVDAYMWGVTEGFDTVSDRTSFKTYSRGYVPTAYGSLRATEDLPIDTSKTVFMERVQLREGRQMPLHALLDALAAAEQPFADADGDASMSRYNRFRHLNPHIDLPYVADSLDLTPEGDVVLRDRVQDMPVRFFLPLGATDALASAGYDFLDPEATFAFARDTYAPPADSNITVWDRAYDDLVTAIGRFGFTDENRTTLNRLEDKFTELAAETPSHYRETQLAIIRTHQRLWQTQMWKQLALATEAALGNARVPIQPPVPLDTGTGSMLTRDGAE